MESSSYNMNVVDDEASETPSVRCESDEIDKRDMRSVWTSFTKIGQDKNGIERASCKYCGRDYAVGRNPKSKNNYGTSHLSRHLRVCKKIGSSTQAMGHKQDGMPARINQKTHRDMLAQAVTMHDLPFSFVEYEKIRNWVNYLNPRAIMPSRNTLVSDINKLYAREKKKLKELMCRIPNRVCLTSDCWTSATTEGYLVLTAHFVDENWKLVSKILNFTRLIPPHTGDAMEELILECLKDWGIDKKVFSITLDNAIANDSMQKTLKNHLLLQSDLFCGGEFFHIRCSAHVLNLIVKDGLAVASGVLNNIRESVKYIKVSDERITKFKSCGKNAGLDMSTSLKLDVPTRWNSTYLMLESALKYELAFEYFRRADKNYKCFPTHEEWKRGEKICEFLEPFHEITNLISGSSYPTSNLYFNEVWKIQCYLDKHKSSDEDDVVIWNMADKMKEKFDKYWKEYSVVLAFGAILDPRLKLEFLDYCYTKVDSSTSKSKVNYVKEKLQMLYEEYLTNMTLSQSQPNECLSPPKPGGERSKPKRRKVVDDYKKHKKEARSTIGKSELDVYLDDPEVEDEDHENDYDVLEFWKTNEKKYPILSILARDVLSIPITTVASESAFSIGGRILTKYRSATLPENIEKLICTRNWLRGFAQDSIDNDEWDTFGDHSVMGEPVEDVEE